MSPGGFLLRVLVRLGRAFSNEAGFAERAFDLPPGSTAGFLLARIAAEAPSLSCVEGGAVDLAVAQLSVNGHTADPRAPERHVLSDGDEAYLFAPISGG